MLRSLGKLRHVVNIVQPSTTADSRGQRTGSDTAILSDVPCEIKPLGGREAEVAHQLYAGANAKIRLYSDPSITLTTKMMVVEQGTNRRFGIGYIKDELRIGSEVELLCTEIIG